MRVANNFYDLFFKKGYNKCQIDDAIAMLDNYEREILMKKYNQNLFLVPDKEYLNKQEKIFFYATILDKIRKYLIKNYKSEIIRDEGQLDNQDISLIMIDIISSSLFKSELEKFGLQEDFAKLSDFNVNILNISIEEISKLLEVPEDIAKSFVIEILNLYKENLNSKIDIVTNVTIGKIKVRKK